MLAVKTRKLVVYVMVEELSVEQADCQRHSADRRDSPLFMVGGRL